MKKMQKTVSILLSVIMLFSLFTIFPIAVNAEGQEEGMSYIQRSWNGTKIMYKEMFCKDYKILDENTDVNLTEGWYVLTKSISLNKRLMINSGTVNLILCDDAELKTIRGIGVSERATLNIYAQWEGTGAITFNDKYTYEKLQEIYPEYFNNAIIGGTNGASGTINIYGGTLTLKDPTEYLKGAAIGGGYLGSTGGITIYGGTIDVKSAYGAAIGGGDVSPTSRVSGKGLIIYGGFITAESKYGAGIGCGYGNNGKSGFIAIYKGKIQAKSKNGAAIGGGYKGSRTGKIDIYGGIIDAYSSEYGAGIGSGENADQIDEINIHGGNVYARAVRGAGIGSGACGDSYKINITGGKVTAHSYSGGAGIGAGMRSLKGVGGKQYGGNANEINISDAVVEAKAFNKEVDNKFLNGMNRLSESVSKAIKDVDMDFSSIPAATLSAIEFGFKIIANLADDDGECYGAGIGAGSRGGVVSINIKNSTVTANGGLQSAGIGSSKQGGIKSINIINSTVESHGDDLGAGIGTGNQGIGTGGIRIENSKIKAFGGKNAAAIGTGNETTDSSISIVIIRCNEVKATGGECGAGIGSGNKANGVKNVYISESTVEANGGEEGAGIGTGNESKTRTSKIEINYYSNITANGGEYAAGIGGGDDVSCGEVWIHGSTVKAYGGKDAAGIGGGEDGHGGQVYIGGSDVYAKGKHYGAGIGGGEDGDGGYCEISSTAKVKAIAGSDGWGIAIGNGDFTTSRKAGTVKLADNLKVKIKKTVYTGDKRVPEMRVSKNVVIYPCDHTKTEWKFYDAVYHIKTCKTCGEKMNDEKERHEWNRDNVCTVCGAKANFVTVTLVETDSTGNTKITKNVLPDEWEYEMPEATNVPKGKEFVCWRPRGESDCKAAGQVIEAKERTYDAVYLNVEDASFIDEEGVERTVSARVLDQGFEGIVIPDGWYVFKGVYYANERIYLKGEVHLILEDDCLYSGTRYNGTSIMIDDVGKPELSLYGQRKQTGTIDLAGKQICVSSASVYGGIVRSTDNSFGGEHHTNIIRGTLDIWRFRYSQYGVVIKGGNIKTYENDSTLDIKPWLEMGWTNPSDSISLKGFRDKPIDGAVKVTDGQAFIDEDGNIYSGFLTGDQAMALAGKTLIPYMENHNFAEPQWKWSSDNGRATVVLTCTDDGCGTEYSVDAKVTSAVDGDYIVYSASCTFLGKNYSTEKRIRQWFDITVTALGSGTASADKTKARALDDIILTVTPDAGSVAASITVTDEQGNVISSDKQLFAMPESCVTVTVRFTNIVPKNRPYYDENGGYVPGNITYTVYNGKKYQINEDGTLGSEVADVTVSDFVFTLLPNDTYQISAYTGDCKDLKELVIPSSYNGKPITVLGNDFNNVLITKQDYKAQFVLKLNKNITEIKPFAFFTLGVTKVTGDTSGLEKIDANAFSWVNNMGGNALDLKLDHPGTINVGEAAFSQANVTVHLSHKTTCKGASDAWANSIRYDFTDAHTYGEPVWTWDEDYYFAIADFTCIHPDCGHKEVLKSKHVEVGPQDGTDVSREMVTFGGKDYYAPLPEYKYNAAGYSIEVTGFYRGYIGNPKDNIEGADKLTVKFTDSNGNVVKAPKYIWVSKETPANGIVFDQNGDVTFTKAGNYHVQLRSDNGKVAYSEWIPIRCIFSAGSDDDDEQSSEIIVPGHDVPKTGDSSAPVAAAAVLALIGAAAMVMFRRKKYTE